MAEDAELARLGAAVARGEAVDERVLVGFRARAARDGDAGNEGLACLFLGNLAVARGHESAARAHYERACAAFVRAGVRWREEPARLKLASSCARLGDLDDAARWLSVPDDGAWSTTFRVSALVLRSQLARDRGEPERERELLDAAARLAPGEPLILQALGEAALRRGRLHEAEGPLRDALPRITDPRNRALVGAQLARVLRRTGRHDEAAELLAAVDGPEVVGPARGEVTFERAMVLARRGDAAAALATLERAFPHWDELPAGRMHAAAVAAGLAADAGRPAAAAGWVWMAWSARRHLVRDSDTIEALERAAAALPARFPSEAVRASWLARGGQAAPGQRIPLDGIDLLRPLGKGGMGTVWQAVHPPTGAELAVKVVTPGAAPNETLWNEIRRVAGLEHPHVVPLVDVGEVGPEAQTASGGALQAGSPWLAMPLYAGGTLAAWCGTASWDRVRRALLELADALGHAHARGLVHLDVKPQNVLVSGGEPRIALSDFGLARALGEGVHQRRIAGTPGYMAPEQRRASSRDLGPWTDLYGLAGIGWALICGSAPHRAGGAAEAGLPPLPAGAEVPQGFRDWLAWLGAADPGARPYCAAEAAEALRSLPEGSPRPRPVGRPPEDPAATLDDLVAEPVPAGPEAPAPARPAFLPGLPERPSLRAWSPPPVGLGVAALPYRRPPLIGRDAEADRILAVLRRAADGGSARLRIGGTSGTGRSALLRYGVELAHAAGFVVLAWASGDAAAGPLLRLLGAQGLAGSALRERIARAWPRFGPPDHAAAAARALEDGEPDEVAGVLRALAVRRRVLVAVDDLEPTSALRPLLAPVPGVASLFVSGLEVDEDERIELAPLPELAIRRLLSALIVDAPGLADALVARAGGRPGFVLDVLARCSARGALWSGPHGIEPLWPGALDPPSSEAELDRAQLDELARGLPGAALALEVLAVVGPAAQPGEWQDACRAAGVALPDELGHRLAAVGVELALPPRWISVLRETAAHGARLARWARAVAGVLRKGTDVDLRRGLAWQDAGEVDRGAALVLQVAQARLRRDDPIGALAVLDRLHPEAIETPPATRLRAHAEVALLRCEAALERLARVSFPSGEQAEVRWLEGRALHHLKRHAEAEDALRAALPTAEPALARKIRHTLALVRRDRGHRDEAIADLRRLLDEGHDARLDLARTLRESGRLDEARAVLDAAAPADRSARWALQRAQVAHALGEHEVARWFDEARRVASPRSIESVTATLWLASLADEQGRAADVLSLLLPLGPRATEPELALVISATAGEPTGRCDGWLDDLERRGTGGHPRTLAVLARAAGRARSVGAGERAARLDAVIARDT